jgi:uncharacterized membrane protein
LTGLFAILPLVITIAILAWVVRYLEGILGPSGVLGEPLRQVGLQFVNDEATAWVVGLFVVLVGIWLLGVLMKSVARSQIEQAMNNVVNHIPVIKGVYKTAAQLVAMLRKEEQPELTAMDVVFCSFGEEMGGGFLGLLASPQVYLFGEHGYHLVYIPAVPVPMTGSLRFVRAERVVKVSMTAEQAMRVYLSGGILSPQAIPSRNQAGGVEDEHQTPAEGRATG